MQLLQGSILRKYSLDVSGNVVEIWSQLESSYPVRYQDVYIDYRCVAFFYITVQHRLICREIVESILAEM